MPVEHNLKNVLNATQVGEEKQEYWKSKQAADGTRSARPHTLTRAQSYTANAYSSGFVTPIQS